MSAAQAADIRAAMQGLRTTSVQMQPSTLPPVVPHLGLGESSTLIPARSFVPRRLCLTPLPCVVGPPIMPSSSPTGRLRRMYERGAQEAALRSDLCRVQHSLNDDILKDKETEDLHWVQQRGRAQIAKFQQRDSQRRSSQWQELGPGGLGCQPALFFSRASTNQPTIRSCHQLRRQCHSAIRMRCQNMQQ